MFRHKSTKYKQPFLTYLRLDGFFNRDGNRRWGGEIQVSVSVGNHNAVLDVNLDLWVLFFCRSCRSEGLGLELGRRRVGNEYLLLELFLPLSDGFSACSGVFASLLSRFLQPPEIVTLSNQVTVQKIILLAKLVTITRKLLQFSA